MNKHRPHRSAVHISRVLLTAALLTCGSGASAVGLTDIAADLVVSGASIKLSASTDEGIYTQDGNLRATEGGITTAPSITRADASKAATLTDTGDGLGATVNLDANAIDDEFEFELGIALDFANNSATETYEITLLVAYDGTVDVDGDDAFAYLQLNVLLDGDVSNPEFESALESDSIAGDADNTGALPSAGAEISDARTTSFIVSLAPGAASQVTAHWLWEGAVSAVGASLIDGSFDLTIADIGAITPPPDTADVPAPRTLLLVGLALVAIRPSRRHRSI